LKFSCPGVAQPQSIINKHPAGIQIHSLFIFSPQ
jgi:hypothetical protein